MYKTNEKITEADLYKLSVKLKYFHNVKLKIEKDDNIYIIIYNSDILLIGNLKEVYKAIRTLLNFIVLS